MKIITFYEKTYHYIMEHQSERLAEGKLDFQLVDPKNMTVMEDAVVLINGQVKKENLELLPNLKMVIVQFTGLNGLDLEALKKGNIQVMNTSAHGIFVAERAVSLLLALNGKLPLFHVNMLKGDWSQRFTNKRLAWKTIRHSKVAIYGYGTIGQEVKRLLDPYDCQFGILDYKGRQYQGVEAFPSLEDLATWCDHLIICAPLNELTENSIDAKIFTRLKGKTITNIGRGKIIQEEALFHSLEKGELGGLASDVWYQYPSKEEPVLFPSKYPIHSFDNVVMTPHNGGFEMTAEDLRYDDVIDKVLAFTSAL